MAGKNPRASATEEKPRARTVEVVATKLGYYGLRRVREGQRFSLKLEDGQALPTWVVPADSKQAAPQAAAPPNADEVPTDSGSL